MTGTTVAALASDGRDTVSRRSERAWRDGFEDGRATRGYHVGDPPSDGKGRRPDGMTARKRHDNPPNGYSVGGRRSPQALPRRPANGRHTVRQGQRPGGPYDGCWFGLSILRRDDLPNGLATVGVSVKRRAPVRLFMVSGRSGRRLLDGMARAAGGPIRAGHQDGEWTLRRLGMVAGRSPEGSGGGTVLDDGVRTVVVVAA
jgi:hypothetical protein